MFFNLANVSVGDIPDLTQNRISARCSSFDFMFKCSANYRNALDRSAHLNFENSLEKVNIDLLHSNLVREQSTHISTDIPRMDEQNRRKPGKKRKILFWIERTSYTPLLV